MKWMRHGFAILWVAAAALAFIVYYFWNVHANFLGIVETRTHKLGPQEPGRIRQMFVSLGEPVTTNQLLAQLDTSDLENERVWLQEELKRLEDLMGADHHRFTFEYEKLRLQRDADASGINQRHAELEAKRAELAALNLEIDHLTSAEQAGLGRSRDLANLVVRRDVAARLIKEEDAALSGGFQRSRPRPMLNDGADSESVISSMLSGRTERLSELKLKLKIIESRLDRRKIIAPCDGRVVSANFLPGDAVQAFATILTVEEPKAAFVDAYIPETSDIMPQMGQRVAVFPHRVGNVDTHGTIVFIDPGYSEIPQRLAFHKITYWARKFRVKLDEGHHLMPGEAAQIELLDERVMVTAAQAAEVPPVANASPPPAIVQTRTRDTLSEIKIPPALRKQSSVEPSGIAWLPDIDRYVIVSDDTSRGEAEHAPWVLLMDRQGQIEPRPVHVSGVTKVNDLESIASGPDGSLYFVSSQSISKKGKRPKSRQQILKVARSGREFSVVGSVDFYSVLIASYGAEQLRGLGLGETAGNGQLILNIEGSAWLKGDLLLGIKEPRPTQGALIWRLKNPNGLIERHALEPGQLSLFGYVDVRTPDGRPASISDLVVDDRGDLFALSTVPKAKTSEQVGGMHHLIPTGSETLHVIPLFAFPEMKPEGLCSLGGGKFTIVFDTDDALPIPYLTVEAPHP